MTVPPLAGWQANRRGAMAMTGAMALITINDSLIKLASESVPAAQAIAVRGLFATAWILVAVLASAHRVHLTRLLDRRTAFRAVLDVAGTFTYLFALFNLPIADATAINMAAPLMVAPLAMAMLGERMRWQRWVGLLVGFAAVLLIVRPGGGASLPWAALCLFATALNAWRDVYTRRISLLIPSLILTLAIAGAVTLTAGVVTFGQGWQPMSLRAVSLLAGASLFLASGYHLGILATRAGDIAMIGAFRYSALPVAALLGWLIWNQLPDAIAGAGMLVLITAGVTLLHHERKATSAR